MEHAGPDDFVTLRDMKIFVAGATGATGQVFVPMATRAGLDLVLHVRPQSAARSPLGKDPRARVLELSDAEALGAALSGADGVVSFAGTMKSRFAAGDTYESSDLGSTRQLVLGAKSAGVPRILLLSSYGAGGMGAYLKMKAACEDIVRTSGLAFTIFRPSVLVSPPGVEGTHGARGAPPGLAGLLAALGHLPGLGGWSNDTRPIPLTVLSCAFLRVLAEPRDGQTLTGRDLWTLGEAPAERVN